MSIHIGLFQEVIDDLKASNLANRAHERNESKRTSECEAVDCVAEATNTIKVNAGNHGTISLSLCNICVNKFIGDDKNW
jgi:hypothetical protein